MSEMFALCALPILVGLLVYYYTLKKQKSREPPGPSALPILGNLLDLANASDNLLLAMGILAEKYGEIYSLKMGFKRTVVLTSKEAMQTVLTNEAAYGRDSTGMLADRILNKNLGIAGSQGEMWEKTRTWTFKTLKDFGFGKSLDMERFTKTASQTLFSEIDHKLETKSNVIEVSLLFNPSILSTMWQMVIGKCSPEDGPLIKILSEKGDAFIRSGILGMGVVSAFPFLRFVFPKALGYNVQMDYFNTCNKVGKKLFLEMEKELRCCPLITEPKNLLEAYVQNYMDGTDPEVFNCENFQIIFQDLLLASTDTSSSFMEAVVLYLVSYPAVQEKVYREILQVAPNGRALTFADRKAMPYTQGFLLESHRQARILQNSLPRRAIRDIKYKEYIIKENTTILCDMRLYCEDKELWGDPEVFRPDRFIGENGEVVNASNIIAFSFGKRNCPGELHANIVAFLLLVSLLQKYKLSVPDGEAMPRLDMMAGITLKPFPFKAKFVKR